jgi:hypothetical protein
MRRKHFLIMFSFALEDYRFYLASMTDDPADYRWSSYPCNALGQQDPLARRLSQAWAETR